MWESYIISGARYSKDELRGQHQSLSAYIVVKLSLSRHILATALPSPDMYPLTGTESNFGDQHYYLAAMTSGRTASLTFICIPPVSLAICNSPVDPQSDKYTYCLWTDHWTSRMLTLKRGRNGVTGRLRWRLGLLHGGMSWQMRYCPRAQGPP